MELQNFVKKNIIYVFGQKIKAQQQQNEKSNIKDNEIR